MARTRAHDVGGAGGGAPENDDGTAHGKRTLTQGLIRRRASGEAHAAADLPTGSGEVPHRAEMERAFGEDFSSVRSSTGADLSGLGAVGAAQGETVAFADASPSKELVAHELTHVVQERRAGGGDVHRAAASGVSDPSDAAEVEADAVAKTVAAGGQAVVGARPAAGVQRQTVDAAGRAGNVDIRSLYVSCNLPAGLIIQGDREKEVRTRTATTLTVRVTADAISIDTSPDIFIDATYPAENMLLYGITYRFASGAIDVRLGRDTEGWGFLDYRPEATAKFQEIVRSGLAGTPAAQRNYNPMTDPNPMSTLQAIADGFARQPTGGGAAVRPAQLTRPGAGGTVVTRSAVDVGDGNGRAHIDAGASIDIAIVGSGDLGSMLAAAGPQAAATAANVQSISLTSATGIHLMRGDKPVAKLTDVVMRRGGMIEVRRFELEGGAAVAAGLEALVRLLAGAADASSRGAPDGLAIAIGASRAEPTIVNGMAQSEIEANLTAAVRQMIIANRAALPGLDLAGALGIN